MLKTYLANTANKDYDAIKVTQNNNQLIAFRSPNTLVSACHLELPTCNNSHKYLLGKLHARQSNPPSGAVSNRGAIYLPRFMELLVHTKN